MTNYFFVCFYRPVGLFQLKMITVTKLRSAQTFDLAEASGVSSQRVGIQRIEYLGAIF
jgi:hypothetical protein